MSLTPGVTTMQLRSCPSGGVSWQEQGRERARSRRRVGAALLLPAYTTKRDMPPLDRRRAIKWALEKSQPAFRRAPLVVSHAAEQARRRTGKIGVDALAHVR